MKPLVTPIGVEHTGMVVRDTQRLAAWYAATFGAREVSRSSDDRPIVFLSFGAAALLELVPAKDDVAAQPSDHVHLCLAVGDIPAAIEALEAQGIELDCDPFRAYEGSTVAFLRDPEGNLVQLVERVDGSAVHRAVFG